MTIERFALCKVRPGQLLYGGQTLASGRLADVPWTRSDTRWDVWFRLKGDTGVPNIVVPHGACLGTPRGRGLRHCPFRPGSACVAGRFGSSNARLQVHPCTPYAIEGKSTALTVRGALRSASRRCVRSPAQTVMPPAPVAPAVNGRRDDLTGRFAMRSRPREDAIRPQDAATSTNTQCRGGGHPRHPDSA